MELRQLGFEDSLALGRAYGIPVSGRTASGLDEVLAAAESTGYPVVVKALSDKIVHKSDAGAVQLNLKGPEAVERAYERLQANAAAVCPGGVERFLVQPMAEKGFELLVGATQDAGFGPITTVGLGGVYVELFRDAATCIGVLTREDVLRMLERTKAGRVLDGYRGQRLDREAVITLTMNVSRLMAEHPEIRELDLNPVIVHEEGLSIVDCRLIEGDPVSYQQSSEILPEKIEGLHRIFTAESVAVIGASRPGTQGGVIFKNCLGIERLYPVNPRLEKIHGVRCYADLGDLPEVPHVGVFAVNAERVVRIFEQFCALGGKGAVIFSDGFAEAGNHRAEAELLEISERYGVPYMGPNCMGVIDSFSKLNTILIPEHRSGLVTRSNGIGVITQSGGIGLELLEMFGADGLGLGRWVSIGNASCVGVPEILAYMGEDPKITIIAIYLEGVADGLKLMQVGREVTGKKPVVVIKGGRGGGAAAALSHTASLAGSHEAFEACCEQAGFYLLEELTEDPKILVNVLSILTSQPATSGDRIAVVSVGGGAGILIADQITEEGLRLAEFAPETRERIRRLVKRGSVRGGSDESETMMANVGNNPVDLFGDCDDDRLLEALRIVDRDPNTDVVIAAIYLQVPLLSEYLPERLAELKGDLTKPLIITARGFSDYVARCRTYMASRGVHTYTIPTIKPLGIALKIWKKYGRGFME